MRAARIARSLPIGAAIMAAILALPAQAATQSYTITSFDSVRVDAPVNVAIITNSGVSARAEGDRALLDRLSLSVSGGLLIVRLTPPPDGERRAAGAGTLSLRISTGDVRRAMLSGGGTLSIDRMRGQRAQLSLDGGGTLSVGTLAVDRLNADLSGGGRMTLAGTAGDGIFSLSGPGVIAADALKIRNARLINSGAGTLTATAITSADITASGAGDVTVLGKPACKVTHAGTGNVLCAGVGG